jgi:predicted transcriptional regulator
MASLKSQAKAEVYWINNTEQIESLISSKRQAIGDYLSISGPQSIKAIAHSLATKPSSLYHHIEHLLWVGLVVEVGSRIVNRKTVRYPCSPYALGHPHVATSF